MKLASRSVPSERLQSGFTLVELLVALALGLAVLVGVSAVYVAAKQAFRFQETVGRTQEDGNFALDFIAKDLRMSGFAGCRGVVQIAGAPAVNFPTLSLTLAPTGYDSANPLSAVYPSDLAVTMQPLSTQNFIRGFDSIPSAMFASGTAPAAGTSASLFMSGGSANAISLSAAMATPDANLSIAGNPYSWGSGTYNLVVADCNSSSLFAGQLAMGNTQIDHSSVMGNNANNFPSSPVYGTDAIVMPLEWSYYYVATRAGASTPSLYRVFYNGASKEAPQELVGNVEAMQVHYGENTNGLDSTTGLSCVLAGAAATCTATQQADVWRTSAAAVTDWSRVVAVRVGLMMISSDGAANPDVISTPTLLGQAYVLPTGASVTRVRKEYSTTVVLRNRAVLR